MHVKIGPLIIILLFEIRIYVKFYYFFISHGFQGSRKIELKTQLQVSKKKDSLNFWRYENSALYKFFLYKFYTDK